ncbi:hypothetical protein QTN47_22580 [Danxiaibacter flavus]|uniref:YD repeat-containing protein n=1 Tax=Danxiaibacter flavus TaxID=3049108 RepID=A0ABV3ZMI3_9BACT|nr:hypothetical protein QNM32_22585 [Chitinophagaceae bacterium DXS]
MNYLKTKDSKVLLKSISLFICIGLCTSIWAQVNIQTGSAEYTIPVFSHIDPKSGLSHDVTISYSSGQGIKVNQIASNIGLGWSLSCGGEIIRVQHGEPDDQYNPEDIVRNLSDADAEKFIYEQTNPTLYSKFYPNGFLYKKYDINYLPKQIAFQPRFGNDEKNNYKMGPKPSEDTQQDVFILNIGGLVKEFVIGKNFQVKSLDGALFRTEILREADNDRTFYNQNILTKIKGFVITDETGRKYTFDKYDVEELHQSQQQAYYFFYQRPTGKFIINRWILTSITEPVTNRSISFEYSQEDWKYITDISEAQVWKDNGNGSQSVLQMTQTAGAAHATQYVIKKINFPDNANIQFIYNNASRVDLLGSAYLSKIEVYQNEQLIKRVVTDPAYFYQKDILSPGQAILNSYDLYPTYNMSLQSSTNAYRYRLALRSLSVYGRDQKEELTYSFDYFTGKENANTSVAVPSRLDNYRDHSGLYNSKRYSASLYTQNENINPDQDFAVLGLLKRIKTPLSGTITFEYKATSSTKLNENLVLVDKYTISDLINGSAYTKAFRYCLNLSPVVTNNCSYANSVYQNAFVGESPGATGYLGQQMTITYFKDSKNKVGQYLFYSAPTPELKAVQGIVTTALAAFIGPYLGPFSSFIVNIAGSVLDDLFGSQLSIYTITNKMNQAQLNTNPLPSTLGITIEFDLINNTMYPSKLYQFSTTANQNVIQPSYFPYSAKQRTDPGKYGNLIQVQYYNRDSKVVYSKALEYSYSKITLDDNFKSAKYGPRNYYSGPYTQTPYVAGGAISDSWIVSDFYNYSQGWSSVSKETEETANTANTTKTTTSKSYVYNSRNNSVKQSCSTESDDKLSGYNTFYAIDYWDTYANNTVLKKMKDNNMVATPCATIAWYKTSASATMYNVTGIVVTDYDINCLKPATVKSYRIDNPIQVTEAVLNSYDPFSSTSFASSLPADVIAKNIYSDNILTETYSNNNTAVSAIKYDYNNWLPCASITNAAFNQVSYTSFENANVDGWQYNAGGAVSDDKAVTGKMVYNLSGSNGTITRTGLTASQTYRITVWAKANNVTVNGMAGVVLFSASGYNLLQFMITGAASVTISGNTVIDELRLLPADARMATIGYDPVTRLKISECDSNNRMTLYEYDSWGRLSVVRDENRNIISTTEYNLKK